MITPALLDTFRKDFSTAVAELEKQYNVKIDLGRITYDAAEFGTRMTVTSQSSKAVEKLESKYNSLAKMYGIKAKYGAKITIKGKVHTVVDINTRSKKYPVELTTEDGKGLKCSTNYINKLVEEQKLDSVVQDKYFFGEEKPEKITVSINGGEKTELDSKSIKVYTVPENASRKEQVQAVLDQGCEKNSTVIAKVLGMNPAYVSRIIREILFSDPAEF